ncbi:MAG: hydrogenase maturation protease [Magnetococcales bacterium]|nr:hydrogenase maturation protease [Magnetococcales bacterium]NGZ26404.1 hydrogenase maturation protease [Magnetococcales bacterium]
MEPSCVLVLGIGNTLLQDDGAGVAVAKFLQNHPDLPPGVLCLDAGTLSFSLFSSLMNSDALIVVDAAVIAGAPVQVFVGPDMDTLLLSGRRNAHQVGIADLLSATRLLGKTYNKQALVALQSRSLDWGEELTPPVAQNIPHAAEVVLSLIRCWCG